MRTIAFASGHLDIFEVVRIIAAFLKAISCLANEFYAREVKSPPDLSNFYSLNFFIHLCTGRMGWKVHRKWKEIKQQPSMLPGPAVPGCCLISFHFLWAIHPIRPVEVFVKISPRRVIEMRVGPRHEPAISRMYGDLEKGEANEARPR